MKREIYEVHMGYVNANGYHASDPTGYPKVVDSATAEYGNDIEKALKKAYGYLGAAESTLSTQDHQVGYCYLIRSSDGKQIECRKFGRIADLPDPEPEPEPEPEEGGEQDG